MTLRTLPSRLVAREFDSPTDSLRTAYVSVSSPKWRKRSEGPVSVSKLATGSPQVEVGAGATVSDLKERLEALTSVPRGQQRLLLKRVLQDREPVPSGARLMLMGAPTTPTSK
eukprot:713590-Pyramimonas_sp.AAC.2